MAQQKIGGLGRGLDALFQDAPIYEENTKEVIEKVEEVKDDGLKVKYISVHDIRPNENQPRKNFDEEKIQDLANSILEHGVIQPIIVRKKDGAFEIVAGERRWRAAIKAGLTEVPTLEKELTDEQNMLVAIIENMQREDLDPIEEAEGLNQMIATYNMTQESVSKSVGKSRPYITNALRLLKLPGYIKESVQRKEISQGHARALLSIEDEKKQKEIFEKVVKNGLSVRDVEKLAKEGTNKGKAKKTLKHPDLSALEAELKEILGTKVEIYDKGKKGKIQIEYYSIEERERLIEILKSL